MQTPDLFEDNSTALVAGVDEVGVVRLPAMSSLQP
ncbi:MAG: hypothetical protein CM15mP74_22230 [Halieaceae bacterium]|nr:MAG: hypothetical protein CM15mP74_22230 [Halieaceae bacterium]